MPSLLALMIPSKSPTTTNMPTKTTAEVVYGRLLNLFIPNMMIPARVKVHRLKNQALREEKIIETTEDSSGLNRLLRGYSVLVNSTT